MASLSNMNFNPAQSVASSPSNIMMGQLPSTCICRTGIRKELKLASRSREVTVLGLAGASPGAPGTGVHLHVEYYDTKTGKLIDPAKRHGWGKAGQGGEGLRGRVVFAGIKGSFPKGTTREQALAQSGATSAANSTTPNQPDNKPAAAPTNVAQGLPGGPSGRALTREERAVAAGPAAADKPPANKPATAQPVPRRQRLKKATGQKTSEAVPTPTPKPVVEAGVASDKPSGIAHAQWGADVRAGREFIVGEDGPEDIHAREPWPRPDG